MWACTFTQDAMTWQLGDQQHCSERGNLSDEEVLARAKRTVKDAAFVGFYESLDTDFWRLKQNVFPNVRLASYIPFTFWFGTLLSIPRLRVTKFSHKLSATEISILEEHNKLDIALYEWARQRFKPELVLYSSYFNLMAAYSPAITFFAFVA